MILKNYDRKCTFIKYNFIPLKITYPIIPWIFNFFITIYIFIVTVKVKKALRSVDFIMLTIYSLKT
jgi:hypothetical protein